VHALWALRALGHGVPRQWAVLLTIRAFARPVVLVRQQAMAVGSPHVESASQRRIGVLHAGDRSPAFTAYLMCDLTHLL